MNYFYYLLKYGKKEHLEQILEGSLYVNSVEFFKKKNNDPSGRFDKDENITYILQPPRLKCSKIIFKGKQVAEINKIKIYELPDDKDFFTHISSFSLIKLPYSEGVHDIIGKKINELGDHVLLINNIPEFMKRLAEGKRKHPDCTGIKMSPVTYLEDNYSGPTNIFNKLSNFDNQKEWRCAFHNFKSIKKSFRLEIGSIRDIASIKEVSSIGNKCLIEIHKGHNNVIFGYDNIF